MKWLLLAKDKDTRLVQGYSRQKSDTPSLSRHTQSAMAGASFPPGIEQAKKRLQSSPSEEAGLDMTTNGPGSSWRLGSREFMSPRAKSNRADASLSEIIEITGS